MWRKAVHPLTYTTPRKVFFSRKIAAEATKNELPATADAVVVGGGVIGASTAYHLAKKGLKTVLLEKHKVTSGTTWHSAGLLCSPRGSFTDYMLTAETKRLVMPGGQLEEESGISPGFDGRGGLSITRTEERMIDFRRWSVLNGVFGCQLEVVSLPRIQEIHPHLNLEGVIGGLYCQNDGHVDPNGLTQAYLKAARQRAATVAEDCPLQEVLTEGGKVSGVATKQGKISTKVVILACGSWTPLVVEQLNMAGVKPPPLKSNKHSYIVSGAVKELESPDAVAVPDVRFFDESVYFRMQGTQVQVGVFEANPTFVEMEAEGSFVQYDLEWNDVGPYLEAAVKAFPALKAAGIHRSVICGPESFTPDGKPIFGESPQLHGLFFNCGMNSKGVQTSGGMGRQMAALVADGKTELDMAGYDVARLSEVHYSQRRWMEEGTQETEVRTYWPALPHYTKLGGRNLWHSPLHELHSRRGAFFGQSANGMEMPRFFLGAEEGHKLAVPDYDWYGYYGKKKLSAENSPYLRVLDECKGWTYSQKVRRAIDDEKESCRRNVALFDHSAFGRLSVFGPGAARLLDRLSLADVAGLQVGRGSRALFLNAFAGVEADAELVKTSEERFLLLTWPGHQGFLKRLLEKEASSELAVAEDSSHACVAVQGPRSEALLAETLGEEATAGMSYRDWRKFKTPKGTDVELQRLSYVGERGYLLHTRKEDLAKLLEELSDPMPDLTFAGSEALADLHLAAGNTLWHGDVDPGDRADEAGLVEASSVSSMAGGYFMGRAALEEAAAAAGPPSRKLITLTCSASAPLAGGEVILRNGEAISYAVRVGYADGSAIVKAYVKGDLVSDDSGEYAVLALGKDVYEAERLTRPFREDVTAAIQSD